MPVIQQVMKKYLSNMKVNKADNQDLILKNKIEVFFKHSISNKKSSGVCVVKDIMSVVTDKWSLFVIYNLGYHQMLRFNELKKNIRGVSSRMLSVTLKKLENHEVVSRRVFAEVPPRVEYTLTPFGKELAEKAVELNSWFLNFEK